MGKIRSTRFPRDTLALFKEDRNKPPVDNAGLRRDYDEITRARMEGHGPPPGHEGWKLHFQTKYDISEEEAAALAVRLARTMGGSRG